ncbi:MAG: hypothetical protein P9M11_00410 [Candidatus Tenebribacter burtonii]|jgi:hypothetical protein|nr:hypothetical protein [Candidatus Tenebribacter burtonii]
MTEGRHYGGFKYRNKRSQSHRGRNSFIGTVITAIAGTAIKDLTSEDSKIKKLFYKVIHPKRIEVKEEQRKILDAEYSVEESENTEKISSQTNTKKLG